MQLRHVHRFVQHSSSEFKADYIQALAGLIQTWSQQLWVRHDTDLTELKRLVMYGERVCTASLMMDGQSEWIKHGVLSYYEQLLTIPSRYQLPLVQLPDACVVHHLFFSNSADALSRLCGILIALKPLLLAMPRDPTIQRYLDEYNQHVMWMCNALWRHKGMSTEEPFGMNMEVCTQLMQLCSRRSVDPQAIWSLTHASAFASLSRSFVHTLEGGGYHARTPVTPSSIKASPLSKNGKSLSFQEYKVHYLDHLHANGYKGLADFLHASLQSLVNRRLAQQHDS
jgi:hypothetical protein